jgi:glutamine phosphoribosylpyrophosphate amidotransferase
VVQAGIVLICGIVGYQGSFPSEPIEAMTTTLSHWEPDGHGVRVLVGALSLARDHLGVKPLCYTELPEGFALASECSSFSAAYPGSSFPIT